MECIEFWSGGESLSVVTEEFSSGGGGVDDDHGDCAEHYLVDWTELVRPETVLFGSIGTDLVNVS